MAHRPHLYLGESPPVPSRLSRIPRLDPELLKEASWVYVGSARGPWPDLPVPSVAISPGAFRMTGVPDGVMDEVPWSTGDLVPFFLAAKGLNSTELPKVSVRSLIRSLPPGGYLATGVGAPLEALESALRAAGRENTGPLRRTSLFLVGRKPEHVLLSQAVRSAPPQSTVIHVGLQEELGPQEVATILDHGLCLVSVRWGQEPDLSPDREEGRALLSDSPLRLRRLMTRLQRSALRPRGGRSPS